MRILAAATVAIGLLAPGLASAQEQTKIEGMENYCYFNSKIYSVGAVIGRRPNITMTCTAGEKRAVWKASEAERDRDRNRNRDRSGRRNRGDDDDDDR
jgi:hypothetical protein